MRRWIALAALAALLAGCAGSPAPSPAPVGESAASAPSGSVAAGSEGSEAADAASPAANDAAADTPVASEPEGEAPAAALIQVPAPALSDLPADLRAEIAALSAWEAAQRAALWRHGTALAVPLTVAPALVDQLASARPADVDRAWVRLVGTKEDGDAFHFQVQVTRRDASGRLELAGSDTVVVSQLEGGVPLVTGYAHGAPAPADGQVAVWAGAGPESYAAPERLELPAPVVTDASGDHLVPVAALEAVWEVARLEDGSAAVVLGEGTRTAALPVTEIGGLPYLRIADLVAAVDGVRAGSAQSSYAYAVEWRPDLGQLTLWCDVQHPIS